ncbi:MAG: hypothetical protein HRO68_05215 [Nitrosopumilus sp.]|nr:hypothetical protein [Nitrosopumilus sp.]
MSQLITTKDQHILGCYLLKIHSKHYLLNIIHILDPMKIPTARTINIVIIICPSSIN